MSVPVTHGTTKIGPILTNIMDSSGQLYCNFDNIGVRGFILMGAPIAQQNATTLADLASGDDGLFEARLRAMDVDGFVVDLGGHRRRGPITSSSFAKRSRIIAYAPCAIDVVLHLHRSRLRRTAGGVSAEFPLAARGMERAAPLIGLTSGTEPTSQER